MGLHMSACQDGEVFTPANVETKNWNFEILILNLIENRESVELVFYPHYGLILWL